MPRVVHVVVTNNFAGVERYVCNVANETAIRGCSVTVIGGQQSRMAEALEGDVRWLSGGSPAQALESLLRVGRQDVCHVHMTYAEAAGVATRIAHRAIVVSTRHFATARGSNLAGRILAPWIASRIGREVAVSDFVARNLERAPDVIIQSGVPASPLLWGAASRVVLVMQRLEREKDTLTALRAWELSGMAAEGWTLRIVGDGTERSSLEAFTQASSMQGVTFKGWTSAASEEFAEAGLFLAPALAEPLGLSVLEAMAAGIPVVASSAGGHLETVGLLPEARMFAVGDAAAASEAMRALLSDDARAEASGSGQCLFNSKFTIAQHVDRLLAEYAVAQETDARA